MSKSRFALYFGNRGFFPGSLMASAREEIDRVLKSLGHETLMLDAAATRHGAVETPAEGEIYADFLKAHAGQFDGVVLSLPNFGDETGAFAALRDAGVPIFVQAYPDDLDKMAPATRRDSFCGKMSICDVFYQGGLKFSVLPPHTVAPGSEEFAANIDHFDRVCRVYNALKRMRVGAIGARTSAFKTVRIDELALERHGITMETYDLSDVFNRLKDISPESAAFKDKKQILGGYANFSSIPGDAFDTLVKMGVVLDNIVEEAKLDAIAVRCWVEMQQVLGISPCVLLSEMNNRLVNAACEVDVGNAVSMYALSKASGNVAACLDWNNNYADDEDKCILFHCGPVPQTMMAATGTITEHAILSNAVGEGCSYGCNVGRIAPQQFTFASMMTEEGDLKFYLGDGEFTADPIPSEFFGCAGVAQIDRLQDVLLYVASNGHRHHVSVTPGVVTEAVAEALGYYLGFDVAIPQGM